MTRATSRWPAGQRIARRRTARHTGAARTGGRAGARAAAAARDVRRRAVGGSGRRRQDVSRWRRGVSRMRGRPRARAVGDALPGSALASGTNRTASGDQVRGCAAGCRQRPEVGVGGDCRGAHCALGRLHRRRVERKHGGDRERGRHQHERRSARRDPSPVGEILLRVTPLRAPMRVGLAPFHTIGWYRRLAFLHRR